MTTSTPTPQLILFLDSSGALCAEVPSLNGARNKIDLSDWSVDDLPPPLADALFEQLVRRQAAEAVDVAKAKAEAAARRKRFAALSFEVRAGLKSEAEVRAEAAERARSGKRRDFAPVWLDAAALDEL